MTSAQFGNQIVFLAIGDESVEQLSLIMPAFRRFQQEEKLVVYTDRVQACTEALKDSIVVRLITDVPNRRSTFTSFGDAEFAQLTTMKSQIILHALTNSDGWVVYL